MTGRPAFARFDTDSSTPSASRSVCAALLVFPASAMAMAPNYGIVEAIVIGLGIGVVLAWLLSVWIVAKVSSLFLTRPSSVQWVGLVYAIVTIIAAAVWADRSYSEAMQADAERGQQRVVAENAHGEACRLRAGEEVFATVPPPPVVYVHVAPSVGDSFAGLGRSPDQDPGDAKIQYVSKFPGDRADGAVFIEAQSVFEPIPGAGDIPLIGTTVELRSADHKLLARRFDVWLNPKWCLSSEDPSHAVRRFVKRVVNIDIGPSPGRPPLDAVQTFATTGTLGPIEKGGFARPEADSTSLDFLYPGLTSLLAANSCVLKQTSDEVFCAESSPSSNSIKRHSLLAGFEVDDGWLSITRVSWRDGRVDMLDAVKRNRGGAITTRWRIRFPPIAQRSVFVESATLVGTHLTVGLVFDPELTSAPVGGPSQHQRVFKGRARLEAELLPYSTPVESWRPATLSHH